MGRGFFLALGSLARMRMPLNGLRSQTSSEDADGAGGSSTFVRQHVVDQGEGVAAAQLVHRPVLQGDALNLDVGDAGDPVLVGRVGPLGSRVALDPGGEVLVGKRSFASVPTRFGDSALPVPAGVSGNPDHLPRRIAALGRGLAPHAASSRWRARKSSTSAGSIRREAPSL
jgi:hypothetical protein